MIRESWEKNWPEIHCAFTGGLPQFLLSRRPRDIEYAVPVFCYHVIDREIFEADMKFLVRNGYVTVDADTLYEHMSQHRQAPARSVVLSFDDGSVNLYNVVFPLLRQYQQTAVAFVSPYFHTETNDDDPMESIECEIRPCSWSEIRQMHVSGYVDFQSHTFAHRYVPRWPEPVELTGISSQRSDGICESVMSIEQDFRIAKETLEQQLDKTVRHLAFPKYQGTKDAVRIAHECGYDALWWGVLPRRPDNRAGQSPSYIVRVNNEFLRRLPGDQRVPLSEILGPRYLKGLLRFWARLRP